MPTTDESMRLAALAREEIRHPIGAYDQITADGQHPLSQLLKGPNMTRHSKLARDQNLDPRGATEAEQYSDDSTDGLIDSDDLIGFVRMCMSRLQGPERTAFAQKLASLLAVAESGNGASDARYRRRGGADTRRPAQDSEIAANNHQSFLERFPGAARIDVWK
jgi:hypothetical protein